MNGGVDATDGPKTEDEGGEPALPWLAETQPGTSLLVAGPPMTRKRRLLYRLLAGTERRTVRTLVSTRLDAEGITREYRSVDPAIDGDRLTVVDCVTDQGDDAFGRATEETPTRRFASDPGDLTGIGIGVSEFMRRYHEQGDPFALGVHTLSTMLMYADLRRVYRFLHVLTSRTRSAGFRGLYVLDESSDDPGMIAQPFDGLVAVRDTGDDVEVCVRGVDPGPDRWTPVGSL